jgi:hypothetical protein
MNKLSKSLILGLFVSLLIGFSGRALAYSPILSVYAANGGGTTVSITGGQPNASVVISYTPSGSSLTSTVTGETDYSGSFTTMISSAVNSSQITATVAGQEVYANNNGNYYTGGCTYYGCSVGGLTLSQTSLSLNVGQSASVTASSPIYGYSNSVYISSNSNSSVASASVSGNQITVYGQSSGSTTVEVCQSSGSSVCASLYVTVSGYNNGCSYYGCSVGGLTLSQTSLSLNAGQSATVTASYPVYNYSNSFYISSNSNSSVASASVSGSQITVYGIASGSTTISVCSNSGSSVCASLYVTVSGYNNGCTYYGCSVGGLTLSQTSLSLNVGQSASVTASYPVYNYSNGFYISSNSNSSVASASVSGSQITVYGIASGSTTISVCSNSGSSVCASLYVTVTGNIYSGSIYFSPSSLSLSIGQNSTVSIYSNGGSYGNYYVSSNSNSGVASASVSGSSLYVNALSAGSTSIAVCQSAYSSYCATLYVTVTGVLGGNTNLWFSPGNPSLYVNQSLAVSINSSAYNSSAYPYTSTAYYISSNSNPGVVSATVSGTVLNLYAYQNGSSSIIVCSSGLGFCGTLYVTVGNGSSYYGGTLSLSQTSISLSQTQSVTVSAYNVPALYVASNSNSNVVSVSISGAQAIFYGQTYGSSTVVLCGVSSSQCASVYVTVSGGYGSNILLNPPSLNLNVGQSATVNVSGSGGYGYFISSNSNPGAVSASFNGSVITVYGIANGSATLLICQNSANFCPSLLVTVGNGPYYNTGYPYNTGSGLQYPGGSSGVLGASTYANGQLISEGSTVYIVYKNTKTAFAGASAFLGLGYSFNNVLAVGNSGLADSGHTVTTQYAAHPWGTWIKNSGSTVYFVDDLGLIPIPDWSTFTGNGGQASFIVAANSYDFKLPILSPMTSGDPRLQ